MVQKNECAYLCGGDCRLCKGACKCHDENDVCIDAVRKVVHMCYHDISKPKKHFDLSTAKGRFQKKTEDVRGYEVYRSCTSKRRWDSEYDAIKWAHKILHRYGKEQRAYHCGFCDGFHLTSRCAHEHCEYENVA